MLVLVNDKPISRIHDILLTIGKKIRSSEVFDKIPIYLDDSILTPNTAHFPCILFDVNSWKPSGEFCGYERVIGIRLIDQSEDKDDILRRLWLFEEELRRVISEATLDNDFEDFELIEVGGSPPAILTYVKDDKESYKATKTLNASVIIVYYRLRYESL